MVWFALAVLHLSQVAPTELEARIAATPVLTVGELRRSRPAELLVVDCAGLPDSRKIATMFLQGRTNRDGPRLYLRGLNGFNDRADDWWLERLKSEYGIASRRIPWDAAFKELGGTLGGIVIWDDKLPATENIAGMLSSLCSWVACAPSDLEAVKASTGLTVVCDLRGVWTDPLVAQRWALQHLVPKLPRRDIGCLCTRAALTTDPRLCRDWLVMRGGVMIDLSSTRPEERALKDEFYGQMAPGSIVWGWVTFDGEVPHVEHASRFSLEVLCTTSSPNLSVFAQLEPKQTSWVQRHSPPPRPIERKLYVAFCMSDGDAPPIALTRYWYRWDDPSRGHVPMAWEVQPLLAELAPIVLEYYYETATPSDRFVSAPPYVLPTKLPDPTAYMDEAARVSAFCDLNIVYQGNDAIDERLGLRWAQRFPNASGFIYGWGEKPKETPRLIAGRPHIWYGVIMDPPEKHGEEYYQAIYDKMDAYARQWGLPAVLFVHLSNYHAGPADVAKMMQVLRGAPAEVVPFDTAMEITRALLH
jgi:hypothetical protein